MRWVTEHPRRGEILNRIRQLDLQRDYQEIYRLTAMLDFAWDMKFGWNLAFYRAFAVPRMARLLVETGEMQGRPVKRAHDTGLLMYELFEHGLDHPRGREVIRRLNRMHHRYEIHNADYLYILAAFAVVPTRFVDEYGWRRMTLHERQATHAFYYELGRRMAIREIPTSYEELAEYLDVYEERHVRHSDAAVELMDVTLRFLAKRLPPPLDRRPGEVAGAFLDERLRNALGLPEPLPSTTIGLRAALGTRRAILRRRSPRSTSWFEPGMSNAAYPEGYALEDLGPESANLEEGATWRGKSTS